MDNYKIAVIAGLILNTLVLIAAGGLLCAEIYHMIFYDAIFADYVCVGGCLAALFITMSNHYKFMDKLDE